MEAMEEVQRATATILFVTATIDISCIYATSGVRPRDRPPDSLARPDGRPHYSWARCLVGSQSPLCSLGAYTITFHSGLQLPPQSTSECLMG